MPDLSFNEVAIGFDMFGCPNRCRHCFMGPLPNQQIDEQDVRRIAGLFRDYRGGQDAPVFQKVWVSTSIREPDFSDDYRRLYELEAELSDGKPWRYELLSIWRLGRDQGYAPWARTVGPDTCQITFFGEQDTTDWFCRRKGAFNDSLIATERLLDAGMKPRWQIFANTRGIGELDSLMRRVDAMQLRRRTEAVGGRFDIFVNIFTTDGRALQIDPLRPTVQDMQSISRELLEASERHYGNETKWRSEGELCEEILSNDPWFGYALEPGHMPWFLISSTFDVFFNAMGTDPWWCLGNVKAESLDVILDRFKNNDTPGLQTIHNVPPQELVKKYGDRNGQRVYDHADSLLKLYVAKHCQRKDRAASP
jgi:hypothetical protein